MNLGHDYKFSFKYGGCPTVGIKEEIGFISMKQI